MHHALSGTVMPKIYSFMWNSNLTRSPEFLFAKPGSLNPYQPSSCHGNRPPCGARKAVPEGLETYSHQPSAGPGVSSTSPGATLTAIWQDGHLLPILQMTTWKSVAFPRSCRFTGAGLLAQLLPPGIPGSWWHSSPACWPHEYAEHTSLRTLAVVT